MSVREAGLKQALQPFLRVEEECMKGSKWVKEAHAGLLERIRDRPVGIVGVF